MLFSIIFQGLYIIFNIQTRTGTKCIVQKNFNNIEITDMVKDLREFTVKYVSENVKEA